MNSNDYGSTRLVVLNSFYLQSWYNNVLHGFAICLECVRTKTWDKLNATEWIAVAFSVLLYLDQFVLLFLWGIQGWYHQIITEAHYCMIKPRETQSHCQYVTKCKDDMTCTPQHEGESESSHSRRWLQRTKSCLCYCVFLLLIFHIFSILMSCHNWFVVSSTLFFFSCFISVTVFSWISSYLIRFLSRYLRNRVLILISRKEAFVYTWINVFIPLPWGNKMIWKQPFVFSWEFYFYSMKIRSRYPVTVRKWDLLFSYLLKKWPWFLILKIFSCYPEKIKYLSTIMTKLDIYHVIFRKRFLLLFWITK